MGTVQVTESVTSNASKVVAVEVAGGAGGCRGYYSIPRPTKQALATRQALQALAVSADAGDSAVSAGTW